MDKRFLYSLSCIDLPFCNMESRNVLPLWEEHWRRSPLPEKDILLGPGVNIYRTPLNGRNFEYMGEDPYLSSIMVVPYIKEYRKTVLLLV